MTLSARMYVWHSVGSVFLFMISELSMFLNRQNNPYFKISIHLIIFIFICCYYFLSIQKTTSLKVVKRKKEGMYVYF